MVFEGKNKQDLALNMDRDVAPALLETLDRFWRNAQNLCHLGLRLSQMPSNFRKLLLLHCNHPSLLRIVSPK